ncbi:MAG TPA: ABC transporter permease [Candidatus Limiplasma sp.]|nr:ABC transporter permease [Candidatus Limiplasma sp.]HRX08833.1 ABC transporter permease [Candidatus Limiplasma sp.]
MKQFNAVLRFELGGYFKSRVYQVMTILFVAVLMIVLSYPNIKTLFSKQETPVETAPVTQVEQLSVQESGEDVIAVVNQSGALSDQALVLLANALQHKSLRLVEDDAATVRAQVQKGQYSGAILIQDPLTATYIARNLSLTDNTAGQISAAMVYAARYEALAALAIPQAEADAILNPAVSISVDNLGVSQTETFFYTYILLMALYMAIMLYGQIVATSIATEKGSRTMELLITSTRPNSLLFGKIIAAALSGLIQMAVIFGSAVLFYNLNASAWAGNEVVASIFNMPLPIVGYVLLFFLLGFSLYAFMFGAIGSLVSRLEDVSASIMPVLLIFIVGFLIVITSMSSGNADSTLLKVCSFIPFTAPMAMFARIAMATPAWYEIVISVVLLIATTVGTGVLSASIYRMGVLMYGKPPKPAEIFKVLRTARKHGAVLKGSR